MKEKNKIYLISAILVFSFGNLVNENVSFDGYLLMFGVAFALFGTIFLMARERESGICSNLKWGTLMFVGMHIFYAEAFGSRIRPYQVDDAYLGYAWGIFSFVLISAVLCFFIIKSLRVKEKRLFGLWMAFSLVSGYSLVRIFGYSVVTYRARFWLPSLGILFIFLAECLFAVKEILRINGKNIEVLIWSVFTIGQMAISLG